MKLKVRKAIIIPDGQHEGVIINIRYRSEPHAYADLVIEFNGITIKAGYPAAISDNSFLGQLLVRFGCFLIEGQEVDPDKILIGKKCCFITKTESNSKGKFARVMSDSVRPI